MLHSIFVPHSFGHAVLLGLGIPLAIALIVVFLRKILFNKNFYSAIGGGAASVFSSGYERTKKLFSKKGKSHGHSNKDPHDDHPKTRMVRWYHIALILLGLYACIRWNIVLIPNWITFLVILVITFIVTQYAPRKIAGWYMVFYLIGSIYFLMMIATPILARQTKGAVAEKWHSTFGDQSPAPSRKQKARKPVVTYDQQITVELTDSTDYVVRLLPSERLDWETTGLHDSIFIGQSESSGSWHDGYPDSHFDYKGDSIHYNYYAFRTCKGLRSTLTYTKYSITYARN